MPIYSWKGEELGEFEEPDFLEIAAIKKFTGMLPASEKFQEAARDGDPDCIRVIIYLLLRRKGRSVKFHEINGKPSELKVELTEEEKAAEAQQAAEKVAPVTRRILARVAAEAGIPLDLEDDDIVAIIRQEFERAGDELEGKEPPDPMSPSIQTTSSTDGQLGSGRSSDSTSTTSNEHHGESLSRIPAP